MAVGKAVKLPKLSGAEIKSVQRQLQKAGFLSVGLPNGDWGRSTIGAVSAFQAHEGLPVNGEFDAETRLALDNAYPAEPSDERKSATASDLKAAGSKIIKLADRGSMLAKGKLLIGGLLAGGGEAGARVYSIRRKPGSIRPIKRKPYGRALPISPRRCLGILS